MKKRFLSLLLAGTMVASLLAGCGAASDGGNTGNNNNGGATTKTEQSGGKAEKLSALFCAHPLTEDLGEMKWLAEFADQANVKVDWEVIRADWDQNKPTRFASGDIPDVLFNATVDSDYTTYDGLFLDLTPYLTKENTPNICAMFEEEPDTKALATTLDGKIYGLPKFQGKWPATNGVLFINKQWLDNLGMDVPKTFTEFKAALTAFKENDVNGNGDPNDEVPFDFNCYGDIQFFNSAYSASKLITCLGIQLTNWGGEAYYAEDGVIKNYAVDERYKLLMKYLADLYSNGLINENAITNDYSTFQSLSRGDENGNALVGCVFGWEETDKFGPELYSQYVALAPLEYDVDCAPGTYDTRWCNDFTGLNMSSNRACVSAKCKDPEAAVRFLDQFYAADNSVQVLFGGITDGAVRKDSDSEYTVLDPLDPKVDNGTWKWTVSFADNGPMYVRRACTINMAKDMTFALKDREPYNDIIAKATADDTYPDMFMKYTVEDQNKLAVTQTAINNVIDNKWALWLTGAEDIDATWDAYVEEVKKAGLEETLKIRQAAFDAYKAK